MRICLEIQSAVAQRAGVGRYTRMLASNLGLVTKDADLRFFYFDFLRRGAPFAVSGGVFERCRWMPGRLAQAAWKRFDFPPFNLFAGAADLYHFPNFVLPPVRGGKTVVTVHDVSFLRFPEFAEEKNLAYLNARIRDTVDRADAVITDSDFSAGEITELLRVPRDRVFAVHLGIDEAFRRSVPRQAASELPRQWLPDRPYILTVGTLEPRKNLSFLVEVFERLNDFDGCLVVAGMRGWKYAPIIECFNRSTRAGDIRYLEYVDDSLLPSLYSGAELFVLPSFYEGFGFPPLEAMACGTPVVSSAGGSLPEVLGDAACIVEGFDADAWAASVTSLLTDGSKREILIGLGVERAARYRWSRTAAGTWDVYRRVLGL